ncbi:HD-GYP domain-containing protein [Methylomarinum vadi]|uniref:HD-GYP domain-containing protein n=1 Tax=Methylomarinum vadi TaxID=438855 RepID=UPI0006899D8B|nr:HD-GYP domain-containing protein [Methylomarinum vadi]
MKDNATRINVQELRIGMFVCELDIPWEQSPFSAYKQGFIIHSREQIAQLRNCCTYVSIDVQKQKQQYGAIPTRITKESDRVAFYKAFSQASDTYRSTNNLVKNVMDDLRFGNQLNTRVAKEAVSDCVNKVLDNSDTMQLLTQLKCMDEYTTQHSLNVCILSILLGKQLKLSEDKLNKLGMCGLLHDMGKSKIPLAILNKESALNAGEMEVMKSHAQLGRDILLNTPGVEQDAIEVAYSHHERLNGSGYPRGLVSTELTAFTRIVSIVDTYDAVTSDRVYQKGKLHLDAIEILIKGRGTHFDSKLVMQFIECIGIYPVGCPVEMTNGEIALVIESNPHQKTKPKVLLLLDEQKQPVMPKLIDLASPGALDQHGKPYKLFKVIKHDAYDLNLLEYHEEGILVQHLSA